jgi:hypothetical protein
MARVWEHSAQSGTHLLMLLAIADFADDDGRAYPSVGTLATKCRMKPRNANVILAALKASGELSVIAGQGPNGANVYIVRLKSDGVQSIAGVQERAGLQSLALTPAKACSPPCKGLPDTPAKACSQTTNEPSENHQEPPKARKRAAAFDAAAIELPQWLDRELWVSWVADRKERRKTITRLAAVGHLAKLDELRQAGHAPAKVIGASIENHWTALYAPKDGRQAMPSKKADFARSNYREGISDDGTVV